MSEESENLSSCFVAFNGTLPLVSTLPLTVTDTDNGVGVLGRVMAAALAIFKLVMGVSIRIDLSVEIKPSSSARYGRIAGWQRSAKRGVDEAVGSAKRPPGSVAGRLGL